MGTQWARKRSDKRSGGPYLGPSDKVRNRAPILRDDAAKGCRCAKYGYEVHDDSMGSAPYLIRDKPCLDESTSWMWGYINDAEHRRVSIRANTAPTHGHVKIVSAPNAQCLAPSPAIRRSRILDVFQWSARTSSARRCLTFGSAILK